MSLFPSDEFWYEAEITKHSRSRCIANNCKEIIAKGELRIGVQCEDKNDSHGWYHAVCLWENFGDNFNENPRISKIEDIKNHDSLSTSTTAKIQELIDNSKIESSHSKRKLEVPVEALPESSPYAMSGSISVKLDKNQDIYVTGDVVHITEKLTSHGAIFKEHNNTGWLFSCTARAGARQFLCMPDELPKVGKAVTLDLAELGRKHVSDISLFSECVSDHK